MKITVSVTFADPYRDMQTIRDAVAFRKLPETWRPSEYAMTKAHATACVATLAGQAVSRGPGDGVRKLDLFSWSVLIGELLRYYTGGGVRSSLDLYAAIKKAVLSDPKAREAYQLAEEIEAAARHCRELQTEAAVQERRLADLMSKVRSS